MWRFTSIWFTDWAQFYNLVATALRWRMNFSVPEACRRNHGTLPFILDYRANPLMMIRLQIKVRIDLNSRHIPHSLFGTIGSKAPDRSRPRVASDLDTSLRILGRNGSPRPHCHKLETCRNPDNILPWTLMRHMNRPQWYCRGPLFGE